MDTTVLKKRLNTYKGPKGTLVKVGEEVVMEVLRCWEQWPGSSADLYRELGLSKMQMVTMIQKAKRLVKSGAVRESEFKELKLDNVVPMPSSCPIELSWTDGKLIRFGQVDLLLDFLKKAA